MEGVTEMLSMVVQSPKERECRLVETTLRDLVALNTDEDSKIQTYHTLKEFEGYIQQLDTLDLACLDVVQNGAVAAAERLRKGHRQTMIILIVDQSVSPMQYIRPTILAAALLLRPVQPETAQEILWEALMSVQRSRTTDESSFVFTTLGENYHIPFSKILYFESREKKVFLRTAHQEYGFYETMEHLQNTLPLPFLRCHKSYIINTTFVQSINLSKNTISLRQDIAVPVSRSYKDTVREWSTGEQL